MAFVSACGFLAGCGASLDARGGAGEDVARWDWQLSAMDLGVDVDVIDLDPDNVTAAQIAALKARGIDTIAYVSVGTVEDYRDDAGDFPASVVGNTYGAWPDEKFLDVRDHDTLLPIMTARFQRAADQGFDAIEPDNMDVHINDSGFDISAEDMVSYVLALSDVAHGMGLEIGQKNAPELVPQLVGDMDFMIAEGCYVDGWCDQTLPYIAAGKPVFDAEYTDTAVNFDAACAYANSVGISMVLKDRDLTGAAVASCQ